MPSYNPALYPSHPIQIPDELPKILKNYTKAAIRTQPTDLLLWSASYFRYVFSRQIVMGSRTLLLDFDELFYALYLTSFSLPYFRYYLRSCLSMIIFRCLSNGEVPPVKERLEYPLPETWHGLTPGLVRVLHKQLGNRPTVKLQTLQKKWRGLSLEAEDLEKMIKEGKFIGQNEIEWKKLLALICLGGRSRIWERTAQLRPVQSAPDSHSCRTSRCVVRWVLMSV